MDRQGRIIIPNEIRKQLLLDPGDIFDVDYYDSNKKIIVTSDRPVITLEVHDYETI